MNQRPKPSSVKHFMAYCYNCKESRTVSQTQDRRLRAKAPEERLCISCAQIQRKQNRLKPKPGPKKKIAEPAFLKTYKKKPVKSMGRAEKAIKEKEQLRIKLTDDLLVRKRQKEQQLKDDNMIEQYLQDNEATVITQKYNDPTQTGSAMEINTRMGF